MAEQLTAKFLVSMVGATLLWVVPVPLKAPRAITTLALMGAIGGYGYAYAIASGLEKQWRLHRRLSMKEDRLEQFQFAVSELAEKAELQALINPPSRTNSANSVQNSEFAETRMEHQGNGNSELNSELIQQPLNRQNWTQFELPKAEAVALVKQAVNDGMGKNAIIEAFWGVKPGGSKAFKAASTEYNELLRSAAS